MEGTTRRKSPKAPSTRLGACIDHIRELYGTFGRSLMTKADIASCLGHSATSGSFLKLLSTLRGFGLLEREGRNSFRISELAIRLKNASMVERDEQEQALKAIRSAPVFAKLLKQYDVKIPPAETIQRRLEEEMGFSAAKARVTAIVFIESLTDAGVLDPQNNLVLARATDEHAEHGQEVPLLEDIKKKPAEQIAKLGNLDTPNFAQKMLGTDIPLAAGRFVRVQYPHDLSADEAQKVSAIIRLMVVDSVGNEPRGDQDEIS